MAGGQGGVRGSGGCFEKKKEKVTHFFQLQGCRPKANGCQQDHGQTVGGETNASGTLK